jgi:hypothetical protein
MCALTPEATLLDALALAVGPQVRGAESGRAHLRLNHRIVGVK